MNYTKKWFNKKIILVALILVLFATILFLATLPIDKYLGDGARIPNIVNGIYEKGEITYTNPLNEQYNTYGFHNQLFIVNSKFESVPIGFIYSNFISVPLFIIYSNNLSIHLIFVLFGLLTSIFTFLILNRRMKINKNNAFIFSILFFITLNYVSLFTQFFEDIPLLFFLSAFIYYFWGFLTDKNNYLLFTLFLFFAIVTKITIIFACPLIFLFIIFKNKIEFKKNIIIAIQIITILFILLLPFFYYNILHYSNPLFFSHDYYTSPFQPSNSSISFIESGKNLLFNLFYPKNGIFPYINNFIKDIGYFAKYNFLIFLSIIFLFPLILIKPRKKLVLFSILFLFVYFLVFGNMIDYGNATTFAHINSHLRYILPAIFLVYIIGMSHIEKKVPKKIMIIILSSIILISLLSITIDYPFVGYSIFGESYINSNQAISDYINKTIPNGSILFYSLDLGLINFNNQINLFDISEIPMNDLKSNLNSIISQNKVMYLFRSTHSPPEWYLRFNKTDYSFNVSTILPEGYSFYVDSNFPSNDYELIKITKNETQT